MKKFLVLIIFMLFGCSANYEKPENYPDWSTPEQAYHTYDYAGAIVDLENFIKSHSLKQRSLWGKDFDEQLKSLSSPMPKPTKKKKGSYNILKVEYDGDTKALMAVEILMDKDAVPYVAKISLVKENGNWVIDISDEEFDAIKSAIDAQNTVK